MLPHLLWVWLSLSWRSWRKWYRWGFVRFFFGSRFFFCLWCRRDCHSAKPRLGSGYAIIQLLRYSYANDLPTSHFIFLYSPFIPLSLLRSWTIQYSSLSHHPLHHNRILCCLDTIIERTLSQTRMLSTKTGEFALVARILVYICCIIVLALDCDSDGLKLELMRHLVTPISQYSTCSPWLILIQYASIQSVPLKRTRRQKYGKPMLSVPCIQTHRPVECVQMTIRSKSLV